MNVVDNILWQSTKIDEKGRCTLPKKLRKRLGLNKDSRLLWICFHQKPGKNNEFNVEVAVNSDCVNSICKQTCKKQGQVKG